MKQLPDFMVGLSTDELARIQSLAVHRPYGKGERILREGDPGDLLYLIDDGQVSIYIEQDGSRHELRRLAAGDYFGEMALINNDRRSASAVALEDTILYGIDRDSFRELTDTHPELADRIARHITERCEELILREHLVKITGMERHSLHIGIGGDPTMRETALFRERRTSEADRHIDALVDAIGDVLLNRCVFHLVVNFNSGEIRTMSVLSPCLEEVHLVRRFVEHPYLERHFPLLPYESKKTLICSLQRAITATEQFASLPEQWQHICAEACRYVDFLDAESIRTVLSRVKELRNIDSLYLRNLTINITQDAIRMQFNCDGTHIVDAGNFCRFIEENI